MAAEAPEAGPFAAVSAHCSLAAALPFLINTADWLLTGSGRQPWAVPGILLTRSAVSPSVSAAAIAFSLAAFVSSTAGSARLMLRYARRELPEREASQQPGIPLPAVHY